MTTQTTLANQEFNRAIMSTFGKLDASDIDAIDGSSERLVSRLVEHYGWNQAETQAKVDRFLRHINHKPK